MTREQISDFVDNLSTRQMVDLHNYYCDEVQYYDDRIFSMYEFNLQYEEKEPLEIVNACQFGDMNSSDEYFTYNGYANPFSFDYYDEENNVNNIKDEIIGWIYVEGIENMDKNIGIDWDELEEEE